MWIHCMPEIHKQNILTHGHTHSSNCCNQCLRLQLFCFLLPSRTIAPPPDTTTPLMARYLLIKNLVARQQNTNMHAYKYRHASTLRRTHTHTSNQYLPIALANPKSHSLTTPLLETRMFSGFTSLWITCSIHVWWLQSKFDHIFSRRKTFTLYFCHSLY